MIMMFKCYLGKMLASSQRWGKLRKPQPGKQMSLPMRQYEILEIIMIGLYINCHCKHILGWKLQQCL